MVTAGKEDVITKNMKGGAGEDDGASRLEMDRQVATVVGFSSNHRRYHRR